MQLPEVSEELTMEKFEETIFLGIAQEFFASVNDEKKLVLTTEDVNTLRSYIDQLSEFQRELCQGVLAPLLERHRLNVDTASLLQFDELSKTLIKRDTDVGIMEDYLQRFRLFDAAVRLVIKSAGERGQELSEKLELLLRDIASVIWRVLRKNDIFPPEPPPAGHLEEQFDNITKEFLEAVFGEHSKETVLMAEITIVDFTDNSNMDLTAIHDVRNYVIVRDLKFVLLQFQRNLGRLIG